MTTARSLPGSVLVLLCAAPALAHPRDELGQTSYVGVTARTVTIELNLTPGDQLAPAYAALALQPDYPATVLTALAVALDGTPLALHLVRCALPERESLRRGEQSVRLFLEAPLPVLSGGTHTITYQNRHAPPNLKCGYLATTLSGTDGIQIGQQTHDATQQTLTLAFQPPVHNASLPQGLAVGFVVLCAGYGWSRRRKGTPPEPRQS